MLIYIVFKKIKQKIGKKWKKRKKTVQNVKISKIYKKLNIIYL